MSEERSSEKLQSESEKYLSDVLENPASGHLSSASSRTVLTSISPEKREKGMTPTINSVDQDAQLESARRHEKDEQENNDIASLNDIELEAAHGRSLAKSILLVITCTTAMILNISSGTSASIALPTIGRHFDVPEDNLQWVVSAFSLSSGCLLIFFGRLADLYGRKKAFLLGCIWTGAFSIGCGFANDIVTLDVLRGFQGLGPAAMVPASLGILAHAFPPSKARSIAFSTFSAGAPLGGALGLQIGGILTEWAPATWRAPFFLSAGLSVLVLLGGFFAIDKDLPSTEKDKRVDWIGAALITISLVLITFVLGQGPIAVHEWRTPYIIALLVVGVVMLLAFFAWQRYLELGAETGRRPPLVKLSMFTRANGKFAVTQCIAFLEWSAFLSWTFWAQLYYQDFIGLAPVLTSIRFLPMFVVGVLCNLVVALVIGHVPMVILVVFGLTLTGIACLLFALIDPAAPYWAFGFPAAVVSVFGADFVFASGTLFVAKVSLPHEQSLAGALFQTLTQLGTAFGLAITTIVHNSVLKLESDKDGIAFSTDDENSDGAPRGAQLKAYHAAEWTAFAFAIFAAVLATFFLRGVGVIGERRHRPEISVEDEASTPKGKKSQLSLSV